MDESRKQFEEWFENYTGCDPKNKIYANMVEMYWQAWQASRAAIELDIDWPESNDDFWKDGEEGAYAMGHEDGKDKTVIAVMKAIRAAGIKEKNFDEANIHTSQRSNQK
ncbi:TPA: hypothetical protein ACWXO9_001083 [Escherichia coli]|uniref:hypothetical protein n=1 Tax=Escherichia TaxID=561 RepID=UPI0001FB64FB|nr:MULTISPECIES: hypothetical protein [Escherichia]EAA0979577.1 hypothetical protein [Escherichia coli]EED0243834.1 hypothetical protein [Escherichia coli]EEY0469333.1 hypothetical protein [Escherichia coli]EEZ0997911.1 hypothetical protein [Escherichia coli]EEZ1662811.1 hypothetical protein [Escherichia coli]